MRGLCLLVPLVIACGPGGKQTSTPKNAPLSAQEIVQRSSAAILRVEAQGAEGEQFGTGFFLDKSGIVATSLHVINGTKEIRVKLHDGTHYPVKSVLSIDKPRDLVLMKVDVDHPMKTLQLGDSNKVTKGEKVVAIGNPLGVFEQTVSDGLISSILEVCPEKEARPDNPKCPIEFHILQISVPISQGSSGGPLFNQRGEVVGITAAIIAQGQLINFAMPANYLKPLLEKQDPIALEDFARATANDDVPRPPRLPKKPDTPEFAKNGFPVSVYDGCKPEQIGELDQVIRETIKLGAPLYDEGNLEACFRIYENLATKMEREGPCKGVRGVFGDVLLKTQTGTFGDKAWHIRFTFDGLLVAATKWAEQKQGAKPTTPRK
jgi:serine protease Do